jgi:hypothetical protein
MTDGIRPDGAIFASKAPVGEIEDFPSINRGWGVTFDGNDENGDTVASATNGIPPMEWDNGQRNKVDNNIWWLMQHAIPDWSEGTWAAGAFVRYNSWVYFNSADISTSDSPDEGGWSPVLPLNGTDGYLQIKSNLSEIANAGAEAQSAARLNLGIDTLTIMQMIYPIGAVIHNTGKNPSEYLGFGDWTQRAGSIYGSGNVTDSNGVVQALEGGAIAGNWRILHSQIQTQAYSFTTSDDAHSHTYNQFLIDGHNGTDSNDNNYQNVLNPRTSSTVTSSDTHNHTGSISVGGNLSNYYQPGYVFAVWERIA